MVLDLFTNPDRFFRQRADDVGLVRPALVVTALGLVGGLGAIPVLQATFGAMPEEASAFAGLAYVLAPVGGIVGAYVRWLLYTVAFHAISAYVYDGEGTFQQTLGVTGWGFLPGIVGAVVTAVLTFYALQSMTLPTSPEQAQAFGQQLTRQPLVVLSTVIGILFLLWQAFLWTFAVEHARGITLREAAITVAVPVAVAVLLNLVSFL